MRWWWGFCALFFACAQAGDMSHPAGGNRPPPPMICPNHPDQCGGKCCGQYCVEIMSDPRNCGECGHACSTGTVCFGGSCGCPSGGGAGAVACGMGQSCCGAQGCKSLMSDTYNCGSCGNDCTQHGGDGCSMGVCTCGGAAACPSGQSCCSGTCGQCSTPDLSMPIGIGGDGGIFGPPCVCADMCKDITKGHLSGICDGPNCCFEDTIAGKCTPSLTCTPQTY
jgi:hypothetical protein